MKKIEAVIPPFKLGDVREALEGIDIRDFTITEMKAFMHGEKHELYRGAEVCIEFRLVVKIEAICPASSMGAVKDAILKAAHTGRAHDGLLSVSNIERMLQL